MENDQRQGNVLGLDVLSMLHIKSKIFRLGARNQNFKLRLLLHELFQEKLDLDFVFVFIKTKRSYLKVIKAFFKTFFF